MKSPFFFIECRLIDISRSGAIDPFTLISSVIDTCRNQNNQYRQEEVDIFQRFFGVFIERLDRCKSGELVSQFYQSCIVCQPFYRIYGKVNVVGVACPYRLVGDEFGICDRDDSAVVVIVGQ